ncbi:MAG: hypothetical protein ACU84Q_16520 [Gammaproteobacteria bacterium]
MKIFQTLFWFILLSIPVALVFAALQAVEREPSVIATSNLSTPKIERAKALLSEHDPRRLKDSETKTLSVSAEELALVANHLIQRFGSGGAEVSLANNLITSRASIKLPGDKLSYYLNVDTELTSGDRSLAVQQLKVGKLDIPPLVANTVAKFIFLHIYRNADIPNARDLIQGISISPRQLSVTYQWQEGLIEAVRDRLISKKDVSRLRYYNQALAEIVDKAPKKFALEQAVEQLNAKIRPDADPVEENRAMIITLSNYVNGRRMSALIPEVKNWPLPKKVKLISHSRHDLAQHFLTSAALAVTAGSDLSDAIGLFKEIDDSDGGSGFSFKDLAADRAGTQFGQIAVTSATRAERLRHAITRGIAENDLIPGLTGLEENMTEQQFKSRYGGVDGEKYRAVVADIDARIQRSPLFQ